MTLLIISFIAGVLTVLAPCILPLLPVIIGGSIEGAGADNNRKRTLVIITSLSISLVVFTILLKVSTFLINVPQEFWSSVSAIIIFYFGITLLFPSMWDKIPYMRNLSANSNKMLNDGFKKKSFTGDIIMGAALGPVFSTCSPTYFLILATILPVSFALGLVYIFVYVAGLALSLFAISILGDKLVAKLGNVSDPKGYFKKTIGMIFILVAIFIATGFDKTIEQGISDSGFFDVTKIESALLNANKNSENSLSTTGTQKYVEIQDNSQYLNSDAPPLIANYVGKKIVMVDFLTYSCINCKRTFPYMNDWYSKYEGDGFVIIGIHTPEFAFEHNIDNVKKALDADGIKFPIVLDNDYKTWNAWSNDSWPHKFLIDIHGNVVYEHAGEGNYAETESEIVKLINEKNTLQGLPLISVKNSLKELNSYRPDQSEETYFGPYRNAQFVDTNQGTCDNTNCSFPKYDINTVEPNQFALSGNWKPTDEYVELVGQTGKVAYNFNSGNVYLVAAQDTKIATSSSVDVYVDGKFTKTVTINASNIYQIVSGSDKNNHKLELKVNGAGFQIYTYTFGQ